MPPVLSLAQLTQDLNAPQEDRLQQGEVVLTGTDGAYVVWALVNADIAPVWQVLTAYEQFPEFLPTVVACRVLERRGQQVLVERKDRRKIGWMPLKVRLVTENQESPYDRIDYRMVDGTLDQMQGSWRLAAVESSERSPWTLVMQSITAKASLGPLQDYFYQVFEQGLVETMTHLRTEMERRATAPQDPEPTRQLTR